MGRNKNKAKKADRSGVAEYDLWNAKDEEGKECTISRQQGVEPTPGWELPAEAIFQPREGPRRRAVALKKPNNRPAVAVPHGGQSVNPEVDDHQEALAKAVRKLEKQKESHRQFAKWLSQGREGDSKVNRSKYGGGVQTDVIKSNSTLKQQSADAAAERAQRSREEVRMALEGEDEDDDEDEDEDDNGEEDLDLKKKSKKEPARRKKKKLAARQAERRTRDHQRHPDRFAIADEIDDLPLLLAEQEEEKERRLDRLSRRLLARSENLQTKKFGRYVHHPLPLEVQPTTELVSNLRHVKSGIVHPAQDRLKSLEERNLIPAKPRHTYNKRKVLRSKGEVMIRREPFGAMPDTQERH